MSARQTVLHAVRLFICGLGAKLGDRREREAEAVASVRLKFPPRGRGKKVPISSRSSSPSWAATAHRMRQSASRIGVKYWTASSGTNQRQELARITGCLPQGKSGYTFGGVNKRDGYFELT